MRDPRMRAAPSILSMTSPQTLIPPSIASSVFSTALSTDESSLIQSREKTYQIQVRLRPFRRSFPRRYHLRPARCFSINVTNVDKDRSG
ncbi:hypothetical protein PENTCL1PPCAC_19658 [Pristionchus entomophagus]|uniref:Uncharacterized protein n=1 Tax=Pristionchus entomophagus TaxID=358040 RepID=A0AAV5TSL5_9BILA|nr:hypothetical protein PENTCL1PPCAC_19658 [Pristionchus entomophagus]